MQEANLAYKFPVIYWNCANLISDSGGEDSTVNYGKIAAAVGRMRKEGISIIPPDINRARFGFKPDVENNMIVYGLKAVNGIGTSQAKAIAQNQPYSSLDDFCEKMSKAKKSEDSDFTFGDTAIISLIKAGAFDLLENKPREEIMKDYITKISKPIKKLSKSNIEDLYRLGLLTDQQQQTEWHYYLYKKYLYQDKFLVEKNGKSPATYYYKLPNQKAEEYFYENFEDKMVEGKDYKYTDSGAIAVKRGSLDKIIDELSSNFYTNVLTKQDYLDIINGDRFTQIWDEKARGSISRWEMDSMNYYYHEHELSHIDRKRYHIANFDELPEEPEIEENRVYGNKVIPRFKLQRICGTVIDKDNNHNTVTLLTPDGVVVVRFYKGQYGFYSKEIATKDPVTNKKEVLEKSWFKRGNMLLVTGIRRGEYFIPKKYKDSIYNHTVQIITSCDDKGYLELISKRIDEENEDAVAI